MHKSKTPVGATNTNRRNQISVSSTPQFLALILPSGIVTAIRDVESITPLQLARMVIAEREGGVQ